MKLISSYEYSLFLLTLGPELVHFDTSPTTFFESVENSIVVTARAEEDSDYSVNIGVVTLDFNRVVRLGWIVFRNSYTASVTVRCRVSVA